MESSAVKSAVKITFIREAIQNCYRAILCSYPIAFLQRILTKGIAFLLGEKTNTDSKPSILQASRTYLCLKNDVQSNDIVTHKSWYFGIVLLYWFCYTPPMTRGGYHVADNLQKIKLLKTGGRLCERKRCSKLFEKWLRFVPIDWHQFLIQSHEKNTWQ